MPTDAAVLDRVFSALSDATRREVIRQLAQGDAMVTELARSHGMSLPGFMKHLRVLEETGVVTRVAEGRSHRLSIEPDVLSVAADWMDRQRALWVRLFDVVDEYLKEEPSQ